MQQESENARTKRHDHGNVRDVRKCYGTRHPMRDRDGYAGKDEQQEKGKQKKKCVLPICSEVAIRGSRRHNIEESKRRFREPLRDRLGKIGQDDIVP